MALYDTDAAKGGRCDGRGEWTLCWTGMDFGSSCGVIGWFLQGGQVARQYVFAAGTFYCLSSLITR